MAPNQDRPAGTWPEEEAGPVLEWEPVIHVGAHEQAARLLQAGAALESFMELKFRAKAHLNSTHLELWSLVQSGHGVCLAPAWAPRPRRPARHLQPRACLALAQMERDATDLAKDLAASVRSGRAAEALGGDAGPSHRPRGSRVVGGIA